MILRLSMQTMHSLESLSCAMSLIFFRFRLYCEYVGCKNDAMGLENSSYSVLDTRVKRHSHF